MRVEDPTGVEWDVTRRWLELVPLWRFGRQGASDLGHGVSGGSGDVVAVIAGLVIFALLLLVGIPLLLFLVALVAGIVGLATRLVFGRPWLVEARSERGELAWRVRGTRASRRAVDEI